MSRSLWGGVVGGAAVIAVGSWVFFGPSGQQMAEFLTADYGAGANANAALRLYHSPSGVSTFLGAGDRLFTATRDPVMTLGTNLTPMGTRPVASQWGAGWQTELDYEESPGLRFVELMTKVHNTSDVEVRPFFIKVNRSNFDTQFDFNTDNLNFKDRATEHTWGARVGNTFTFSSPAGADYSLNVNAPSGQTANLYVRGGTTHPYRIEATNDQVQVKYGSGGTIFQRFYRASGGLGGLPVQTFGPQDVNDAAQIIFTAGNVTSPLAAFRAWTSQTGDMTRWVDSAGTTRTRVNASGLPVFPSYAISDLTGSMAASAQTGAVIYVSDGNGALGSTVTGSGTGRLARSNGTNWIVM